MNRGDVGDDNGGGDGRVWEETESRLNKLVPIVWIDDVDGSAKLVVVGEVARGVVEGER